MGPATCAVVGCGNNSYQLNLWKKKPCDLHENKEKDRCGCEPPFRLFCFPGVNRYRVQRERWVRNIRRVNPDKSTWCPKASDRVCSQHFVDNIPTVANPDPNLNLGYEKVIPKPRRTLFREPFHKKRKGIADSSSSQISPLQSSPSNSVVASCPVTPDKTPVSTDHNHNYSLSSTGELCPGCKDKNDVIQSVLKRLEGLKIENRRLKQDRARSISLKPTFSIKKIKSDQKMNFYTGLPSVETFHVLFELIKPKLPNVRYWRGAKKVSSTKVRTFTRPTFKNLSYEDEFLLTLMRLRLGLLNEDLADRSNISPAICSNTFKTWIRLLRILIGDSLIQWLPIESIRDNLPEIYTKAGHHCLRCVIDCTEVFIERPKNLEDQAQTDRWFQITEKLLF